MGLIYMRISPTGGKYIGQTTNNEKERWREHVKEAAQNNSNSLLNQAIRKYGGDNFSVKILEDNIPQEKLNEREKYWINKYQTYYLNNVNGYNMTNGGSNTQKTKTNTVPVLQYDLAGNFIKEWNCAAEITAFYNDLTSNLLLVLEHRRLYSYKKFLWKYIDDKISIQKMLDNYAKGQANRSYRSTEVYCVETDTYYPSFSQAEKALNISRKLISKYAKLNIAEPKSKFHFKLIKGE